MNAITIDKSIPIPGGGWERPSKYPFQQMEVGDSFLVTPDLDRRVRAAASHAGKRDGKKFSVRTVQDGLRIWRVE